MIPVKKSAVFANITSGTYELAENVKNPTPDRRSKDWEKLPIWESGETFVIRVEEREADEDTSIPTKWLSIRRVGSHYAILEFAAGLDGMKRAEALLPHLKPIAETPEAMLTRLDVSPRGDAYDFLRWALKKGELTRDHVEVLIKRWMEA